MGASYDFSESYDYEGLGVGNPNLLQYWDTIVVTDSTLATTTKDTISTTTTKDTISTTTTKDTISTTTTKDTISTTTTGTTTTTDTTVVLSSTSQDIFGSKEQQAEGNWMKIFFVVVLFVIGFSACVYVFITWGSRRKLKHPENWFSFNIIICNMCFLFTFPLFLIEDIMNNADTFAVPLCLSRDVMMFINGYVTILLLTASTFKINYRSTPVPGKVRTKWTFKVTASVWASALVISLLAVLLRKFVSIHATSTLLLGFPASLFVVCLLVVALNYFKAIKRNKTYTERKSGVPSVSNLIDLQPQEGKIDEKIRRFNIAPLVIWTLMCYIPFHTIQLMGEFSNYQQKDGYCRAYGVYSFMLAYVNASMNPLLCSVRMNCISVKRVRR